MRLIMSDKEDTGTPLTFSGRLNGNRCDKPRLETRISTSGSASYETGLAWGFWGFIARIAAGQAADNAAQQAIENWVRQNCPGYCPDGCKCKYYRFWTQRFPSHQYTGSLGWLGWGGIWTVNVVVDVRIECWST